MDDYIKSDLMRYYGKQDMYTFLYAYFRNRTFRFQCALRLCHVSGGGNENNWPIIMDNK